MCPQTANTLGVERRAGQETLTDPNFLLLEPPSQGLVTGCSNSPDVKS
jgi:hypothetical protein